MKITINECSRYNLTSRDLEVGKYYQVNVGDNPVYLITNNNHITINSIKFITLPETGLIGDYVGHRIFPHDNCHYLRFREVFLQEVIFSTSEGDSDE